jgi:hypothetical protein
MATTPNIKRGGISDLLFIVSPPASVPKMAVLNSTLHILNRRIELVTEMSKACKELARQNICPNLKDKPAVSLPNPTSVSYMRMGSPSMVDWERDESLAGFWREESA